MADAQLSVELQARITEFNRNMRQAASVTEQTGSSIDKTSSRITSALAGAFSVSAIVGFGKEVLAATAEYQKFQAVLGNTLGSSALANLKLKELQDFAAKTPFGVNELTGAFVKLANSGFKPTGDEMRKLGDLASSTGKSFDQLAEAILDAQTGEFERLKEFGVRAKDAGDSVIFTYKGVETQVDKTSASIRNYITSLGDAEGTSGAMAKISETLGGKISNLGDSWDQMLIVVGGNTEGVFNTAIDVIGGAINAITEYNKELQNASKYNLGGGFKDTFQRFARAFSGGKGPLTELETLNIVLQSTSDTVNKLVSETARGAKSSGDFGKALATLKKQGDATLKNVKVPGLRDAIRDIYQEGIKAVQDARTNFNKELNKPDANFGKGKGTKVKIKAPELEIPDNPKKIFEDLFKKVSAANASGALTIKAPTEGVKIVGDKVPITLPDFDPTKLKEQIESLRIQSQIEAIGEGAKKAINDLFSLPNVIDLLSSSLASSFEAMGQAIASGGDALGAAGEVLKSLVGGIMTALGQQLITLGAAKVAAGILATPFGGKLVAEGTGLIAIGAGLSVAGGFAKNAGRSSSNGSSGNGVNQVRGFATGGNNLSAGIALVGERGPELVNLPTGSSVYTNNRSMDMLAGMGGSQEINLQGELGVGIDRLYFKLKDFERKVARKS